MVCYCGENSMMCYSFSSYFEQFNKPSFCLNFLVAFSGKKIWSCHKFFIFLLNYKAMVIHAHFSLWKHQYSLPLWSNILTSNLIKGTHSHSSHTKNKIRFFSWRRKTFFCSFLVLFALSWYYNKEGYFDTMQVCFCLTSVRCKRPTLIVLWSSLWALELHLALFLLCHKTSMQHLPLLPCKQSILVPSCDSHELAFTLFWHKWRKNRMYYEFIIMWLDLIIIVIIFVEETIICGYSLNFLILEFVCAPNAFNK